ncbi:MAG: type IV pilus modification PilV family protein [Armatimonadota bacterium]
MTGRPRTRTHIAYRRQGFTLVEVLVAVIILLIGVVAALRIFPRGFDIFSETQHTYTSLNLVDRMVNSFQADPYSVPDAIMPVAFPATDDQYNNFSLNDTTALEYATASGTISWLGGHLYPSVGGPRWPLMEPRSVRILRQVVGERFKIPSEFSTVDPGSGPVNLAFLPKYFPRFGPVMPGGMWNGTQYFTSTAQVLTIYDQRYRKVTQDRLDVLQQNLSSLPDTYYYAANYPAGKLYFLPLSASRNLRFTAYVLQGNTPMQQVRTTLLTVSPTDNNATLALTTTSGTAVNATGTVLADRYVIALPAGWQFVPGSEQINRAYEFDESLLTETVESSAYVNKLAALESGKFYIEIGDLLKTPPTDSPSRNILLGAVFFSKEDAGRTVKIDYTVADWNILHEDLSVDDNGYVTLALPDPKIQNKPSFPREPNTWGLYNPMKDGSNSVVMGLVDLSTGLLYHVTTNNASARQPIYEVAPVMAVDVPLPIKAIDMAQAQRGRIRLGGGAADPEWSSLRGHTFRVFYRARRDWTLQVFKPPALFWYTTGASLGLDKFSRAGNVLAVSGIYEGQSLAIDYQYRHDISRVTEDATTTTVKVDTTTGLAPDMTLIVVNPGDSMEDGQPVTIAPGGVDSTAKTVTLTAAPAPAILRGAMFIDPASPLQQMNGEVHALPKRLQSSPSLCKFSLRHLPISNSVITVRGVSVTIRGLWVQPRSSTAFVYKGVVGGVDQFVSRTINERWQAKSVTVVLPTAKD